MVINLQESSTNPWNECFEETTHLQSSNGALVPDMIKDVGNIKRQSMPRRNWCTSVNLHVHPGLHKWLILILWNCTCDARFVYQQYKVSCCWSISNISSWIKQDKAELPKQKVTVNSVTVAKKKFLFGMCDCMVWLWCYHGWCFVWAGDFVRVLTCACALAHVSGHGLKRYSSVLTRKLLEQRNEHKQQTPEGHQSIWLEKINWWLEWSLHFSINLNGCFVVVVFIHCNRTTVRWIRFVTLWEE